MLKKHVLQIICTLVNAAFAVEKLMEGETQRQFDINFDILWEIQQILIKYDINEN